MVDPVLERSVSSTGLSVSEELQAQNVDTLNSISNLLLRANFEKPHQGWPEVYSVPRPKIMQRERKKHKEEVRTTSAEDVVSFTEQHREW